MTAYLRMNAAKLLMVLILAAMLIVTADFSARAAGQYASVDASYIVMVADQRVPIDPTSLQVRAGVLLLPIRPIADRLLADLEIDTVNHVIKVTRADDRQELEFDGKTNTMSISGFRQGVDVDGNLIDWTPGKELVPQNLIETFFNCFVGVDNEKKTITINPNSAAFAEALNGYQQDQAKQKPSGPFKMPTFKLNAVQYDSNINENSTTRYGEITTFRTTSQINQNVINSYATYLGSSKGPGFKFSTGGADMITPSHWVFQGGDFSLKTGTPFAKGINRGFIGEKYFGKGTKVGLGIGALQSRVTRIGLQFQRPLFQRNDALFYATFDSADFANKKAFKRPLWTDHRLFLGAGAGGFGDNRAGILHGQGVLTYFYARDAFTRFNGALRMNSEIDAGASESKRELLVGSKRYRMGGVYLVKQDSTLFNRLTLTSLLQKGSAYWSTLDTSNTYRNQYLWSESLSYKIFRGFSVFGTLARSGVSSGGHRVTKTYAGGANINLMPNFLPEIVFSSNVQDAPHRPNQYFNTLAVNQPLNRLRTNISGLWLFSNTANKLGLQSSFSMSIKTNTWKRSLTYFNRQWFTPDSTNTQVGFDSGGILGHLPKVNFAIGQSVSPTQKQSNWLIGSNAFIPWLHHRVNFTYSQYGKSFQLAVAFSGFLGREGVQINSFSQPVQAIPPTGTLTGRFFVDNDLSGTFDPAVDTPMANLRVIGGNQVLAVTDAEGRYKAVKLPKGFLSVTTDPTSIPASYAFITPLRQDTFILPNKTKVMDFRFAKLARVEGFIKGIPNSTEAPVKDLRVYIEGTDRDTLTDDNGHFYLSDVTPGKVTLRIDPEYLQPYEEVDTGTVTLNIMPNSRTKDIILSVKKKTPQIEEKHF